MKQYLDYVNSSRQFQRRGTLGIFTSSSNSTPPTNRVDSMRTALKTRLPVLTESQSTFAVVTTGSTHPLVDGGIVIIDGRPQYINQDLCELARVHGFAAALARGYEEYSQDVFTTIMGSFCCAIIDVRAQRVLLGIDRMGQQSMYHHDSEGTLCFGSSAGSVLACIEDEPALLNQGIYNYLYFHMVPSPGSVFQGIRKLPGAHFLDYQNGQAQLVNYWRPTFSESKGNRSFEVLSKQLNEILRTSVKQCVSSAGKTGSFLSGGLDSSTVTGIMSELCEQEAAAYSIGFAADGYDEMAYARTTARHFKVELNEYYVTPQDVVDALPMVATSYDEPFGNSSALPAYFCAKLAVENGVHTLLAGDGGDEIFGGNERYVKQRVFEHYNRIPGPLRKGLIEPILRALPAGLPLVPKANSYIAQANTPLPDRLQSYNFLHRHAAGEIFSDDFLRDVNLKLPLHLLRAIHHRPEQATDLNRMLYLDWQITLADNDLRKVSHMCALAGVDVAYPMLNDELVEFSCQVPSAWKIKGGDLRHFYKRALTGWLPQETINKTKQGFGLPFGVWMQTYKPLREMAYDNLIKLKRREFIRSEFIDKAIAMHQSEHAAYYGELVWILTVFELWMEGRYGSKVL